MGSGGKNEAGALPAWPAAHSCIDGWSRSQQIKRRNLDVGEDGQPIVVAPPMSEEQARKLAELQALFAVRCPSVGWVGRSQSC